MTSAQIRNEGEATWRDLDRSDNTLTGQAGNPEQYLSLTAIWDTSGAYTRITDVRVREGFAQVLDRLTGDLLATTGVIAVKRDGYSSDNQTGAIDLIDDKIEAMEARLVVKEKRLAAKYARLEATLAQLDAQRGAFEALFTALEANNNSNSDD